MVLSKGDPQLLLYSVRQNILDAIDNNSQVDVIYTDLTPIRPQNSNFKMKYC